MTFRNSNRGSADRFRRTMLTVIIVMGLLGTLAGWYLMVRRGMSSRPLTAVQGTTTLVLATLLVASWLRWLRQHAIELCCLAYTFAVCAVCMVLRMYLPAHAATIELEPLYLWFPVLYVFAFVLTDHRTGLVISLVMLLAFVGISLPFLILDPRAPDANITLQVYVVSAAMIATLYFFSGYQHRLRLAQAAVDELAHLSSTDDLTRLANRRHMAVAIGTALAAFSASREPFAVMLFDVDHFKQINDRCGHGVGDAVLVALAVRASEVFRGVGVLGRWGGDEFVVLVRSGVDEAGALDLGQALCAGVARERLAGQPEVTISCGVTVARRGDTVDSLLQRADAALYAAKRAGRDRVESIVEPEVAPAARAPLASTG